MKKKRANKDRKKKKRKRSNNTHKKMISLHIDLDNPPLLPRPRIVLGVPRGEGIRVSLMLVGEGRRGTHVAALGVPEAIEVPVGRGGGMDDGSHVEAVPFGS